MNLKYKILGFLRDHTPVMCNRCFSIHFEKNMKYEWSTTGKQIALCWKCHDELFRPFSRKAYKERQEL